MAALLTSVSPITNTCSENARKPHGFFSQISKLHSISLNKGFSRVLAATTSTQMTISPEETVFQLPNWRCGEIDSRTRDINLNDAFLYMEYMVGKGYKPYFDQATQLLHDLCSCGRTQRAARVMEMMVRSGCPPDAYTYSMFVGHLCKRRIVGHAMQIVKQMEELGYPTNIDTYNALIKGSCARGNLNQAVQFIDRLMQKGLVPNSFTYSYLEEATYKHRGVDEATKLLDGIIAMGGTFNLFSYNNLLNGLCGEG